jgi:hypothetical protein
VPRRRLDREPHGFEPADELTNVLPHFRPGVRMGSACQHAMLQVPRYGSAHSDRGASSACAVTRGSGRHISSAWKLRPEREARDLPVADRDPDRKSPPDVSAARAGIAPSFAEPQHRGRRVAVRVH